MSEPFIAEIRIFAGNFAPRNWAYCDGQLLPIQQNTSLFSLIGTIYGGDGRNTTALPNMQGRAPMHPGQGPGLTDRVLGEIIGQEAVTLSSAELPNHSHTARAATALANSSSPSNTVVMARSQGGVIYEPNATANLVDMAAQALTPSGNNQAHANDQPFLALNFIIALAGMYPARG